MALIELYLYSFKSRGGSVITAIKLYRKANNCGLAEAKHALDTIYTYNSTAFRNTLPLEPMKTPIKKELLFYSGDDVRFCLELKSQLDKEVGKTEIIYNGNMKTLELLYGRT